MQELKHCPICGSNKFSEYLSALDHTVSKQSFSIVNCDSCLFKFTNPRPEVSAIGKYYESNDYVSHSKTNEGFINKLYHMVKKSAIKEKIRLVEQLSSRKTLLDIGCGTGSFIGELQKKKWAVTGIEPNVKARNYAIKDYAIPVFDESKIGQLEKGSFSIITLWHVLEHVHDLQNRVKEIQELLSPGGFAIIAVPNYTSWDAQHYKEYWAGYDVPRHLYHFSPSAIKSLFANFNFKHVSSLPMKMDAFYVSLLSEKYKRSPGGMIQAFFKGLFSNLKTKNDAEKYSSVIYVFQR